MNQDLISRTLAEHAALVDDRSPDLAALHARVSVVRRRRQAAMGVVATALVAVATLAVVQASGSQRSVDPVIDPTEPSVTTDRLPAGYAPLPFRGDAVEVTPPSDARAQASPAEVIVSKRNDPGMSELRFTIAPDADLVEDVPFCRGSRDLWLVVVFNGNRNYHPCAPGADVSPEAVTHPFRVFGYSDLQPDTSQDPVSPVDVQLFVTTADVPDTPRTRWHYGIPPSTTAEFGLVVHGQTSPVVGTIVGHDVSVLGGWGSRHWWFVRGVEAPTGAESLTIELPASASDRMVQTVAYYNGLGRPMPFVQISLDGRDVDHRFEQPKAAFLDETSAYVPAGGPHTIELRVTQGLPQNVEFGLAIFEAD